MWFVLCKDMSMRNNALPCALALQPAPSWSSPVRPWELPGRSHHRHPRRNPHPHPPITKHWLESLANGKHHFTSIYLLQREPLHQLKGHQHPGWQLESDLTWVSLMMMKMMMWCVLENRSQYSVASQFLWCKLRVKIWNNWRNTSWNTLYKY